MRRLIVILLLTATSLGYAQIDPCVPSVNPVALERVTSRHNVADCDSSPTCAKAAAN